MTIHRSPLPSVPLTGLTITERLFQGLTGRPDTVVMVDGPTGRGVTAGDLIDGITRLAGGLAAKGIGPANVVAILAPNMPEYVVAFHGPLMAGATVTTINPTYTAPEVRHQLHDSGARLLITVPAFLETARAACEGTAVTGIAVMGEAQGATPLTDWMGAPLAEQVPVDTGTHVAVLPYSSGTTGLPKGVMLTHRNLVVNVDQTAAAIGLQPGDWSVGFLPFFHIYGQTVLMNLHLAVGAQVVTMPRFDLGLFLQLCAEYRTPLMIVAPPVAVAIAKHPMVGDHDLSATRRLISGAAPLGGDVADAVGRRLGLEAVQAYGMTELSPVSHLTLPGQNRPGTVGVALPDTECRIVDPETGQDAQVGELWVRGPQVMRGYHANPAATAATLTPDGWLRTGDLGEIDADGYLTIRDRLKELIKVKGFQVAPAEVEAALLSHPGVMDAAVIGRPDDEAGEVPVAFVQRPPGGTASAEEITAHLAGHLSSYKLPRRIRFVEAIPKSASGKILRRLLRDAP
jgi:acyl-CoA synthetase (AMP-forming)/AMP-acid ligase II